MFSIDKATTLNRYIGGRRTWFATSTSICLIAVPESGWMLSKGRYVGSNRSGNGLRLVFARYVICLEIVGRSKIILDR